MVKYHHKVFEKMAISGAFVFHKHTLFHLAERDKEGETKRQGGREECIAFLFFIMLKSMSFMTVVYPVLQVYFTSLFSITFAPPGWFSGECVLLMTWWLVRDPVEANFLSGIFSSLTSAEACEKSSQWLWKESCVSTGVRNPGNTCASPTTIWL